MPKTNYKKGIPPLFGCYLIWGFQPLYWSLCGEMDTLFLMASRTIWAAVCCVIILTLRGNLNDLKLIFTNRKYLIRELFASVFLFGDWIIYLIAIKNGRVMECALGYYILPLVIFSFGAFLFKEKITWKQVAVLGFVVIGIILSANGFGTVPYVTISLALCFAIYTAIKRSLDIDSTATTTAEIIILVPLAVIYIVFFGRTETGLYALSVKNALLLIGSGVVTGLPMVLFSIGINNIPLTISGMFQYLSPTISLFCGAIMGEELTKGKLISFAFIWVGLIVYSIVTFKTIKATQDNSNI
jgi:rarD protein